MSRPLPRPLRVLHVITDTERRGAQVFAIELGKAFASRGHEVETVALCHAPPASQGGARVSSEPLPIAVLGRRARGWTTLRALRHRMAQADITIAHGSSTLLACVVAGLGPGRPFVYRQISDSRYWADTLRRRARVAFYLRFPRRIVALSDGAADILHDYLNVDRRRIDVVPNGVPDDQFGPVSAAERAAAREALGVAQWSTVAASVGALVREKGIEDAINALRTADHVTLLVSGAGADRPRLEHLARDLPGRVHFLGGAVAPRTVFDAADMVVLPSRAGDSMPATLIEAGFCGLATIATPVGSIEQVVVHDDTGLIVPAHDVTALAAAIMRLRDEPLLRARLGTQARQRCLERFGINAIAAEWENALRTALPSL